MGTDKDTRRLSACCGCGGSSDEANVNALGRGLSASLVAVDEVVNAGDRSSSRRAKLKQAGGQV